MAARMGSHRSVVVTRRFAVLLVVGLALVGGAQEAEAEPRGLLVRFDPGGAAVDGPVKVTLTNPEGKTETLELKDDGLQPDVAAGDSAYSAAASVNGDQFTVQLLLNGSTVDAGSIAWKPEDQMRDLDVRVSGGSVTLETGVASPGATGDGGAPGGAPGGPSGGGAPQAPPHASRSADPLLFFGLGLVLVVMLVGLWRMSRGRPAPQRRAADLEPQPEAGLLGEGTPSLSDGLSLWRVEASAEAALAQGMLRVLARHHRVVVVAPAGFVLEPVAGGTVYRCAVSRPSEVEAALLALHGEPGRPLAALVVGMSEKPAYYKDLADALPPHTGGVALIGEDLSLELPTVTVAVAEPDAGWTFQMNGSALRPAPDRLGLLRGDPR